MTTTHKFSIGDRVRIKPYADLPDDVRTKGASALCGKDGEIVDIIYSNANHKLYYVLQFDGYSRPSTKMFTEDSIDFIPEEVKTTYRYDFSFLENVVVASLIEIDGDGNERDCQRPRTPSSRRRIWGCAGRILGAEEDYAGGKGQ